MTRRTTQHSLNARRSDRSAGSTCSASIDELPVDLDPDAAGAELLRREKIGLRMALGAPRGRVLRLIVREGMAVGAIGIGAGLAGALALVALAACVIPARNASRVDPMVALRCD